GVFMEKIILAVFVTCMLGTSCAWSEVYKTKETYDANMNYSPGYDSGGGYEPANRDYGPPIDKRGTRIHTIRSYEPAGPEKKVRNPYQTNFDNNMEYSPGYDSGGGYEHHNAPGQ